MNKVRIQFLVFALILVMLILLSSCGSGATSTVSSPTNTASTFSESTSTTSLTFGDMATSGGTIYEKYAAKCHGQSGQGGSGPSLIGSKAGLAKYNTAQGLLDYVKKTMPVGSPGSLTHQDYLNVLCYLLLRNNFVSGSTVFNESQLVNIELK
jgi:hypothetical protein